MTQQTVALPGLSTVICRAAQRWTSRDLSQKPASLRRSGHITRLVYR